ncbi:MAG TPA: hypothetical protein VG965_05860 [Patescibacteria group bacterium]|nr:hypothetical protein [Patescibacteria group bacterium]
MSELLRAVPEDVQEFVAESRRKSYKIGGEPNYPTGKANEYGFKYEKSGMRYVDVSTEHKGRFAGQEYVERISTDGKFYVLQYAGGNTQYGLTVGRNVDIAQHNFVMDNPGVVRAGAESVSLQSVEGDDIFTYEERGSNNPGHRSNYERMFMRRKMNHRRIVYDGHSQLTVFEI